jgi:hypothetical protein
MQSKLIFRSVILLWTVSDSLYLLDPARVGHGVEEEQLRELETREKFSGKGKGK